MEKQESFYKPSIVERRVSITEPLGVSVIKLTNQLISDVFQVNPQTKLPITIETGSGELKPHDVRKQLEAEITDLVKLKYVGVIAESEEAKRMKFLTRPLLRAFTQGTHIRSVQAESFLGFVSLALDFSRNPSLMSKLTIQTGFGGSIDPQANLRLPAYAVPSIKMVENLREVSEQYNLGVELPTIRFAFAPHAAIAINGAHMPADRVLDNTARNMYYLAKYIKTFHPGIDSQILFDIDVPWNQHDEVTRTIHQYFSNLLLQTEDPSVRDALSQLQKLGLHHGHEDGQKLAHDYTAVHSLIFQDAPESPNDNFFHSGSNKKPLMCVSIGGHPERLFNVARNYIRRQSSIESLRDYSDANLQEELAAFEEGLKIARAKYGSTLYPELIHDGDKPIISVTAITTVGANPVYYATEYDLLVGSLDDIPTYVLEEMERGIERTKRGQEKSLAMTRLRTVRHDLNVAFQDAGGEMRFLEFIENLKEIVNIDRSSLK